jgi:hypothetical protein
LGSHCTSSRRTETLLRRLDRPPALPITKPHESATRSVHDEAEQIADGLEVVHAFSFQAMAFFRSM